MRKEKINNKVLIVDDEEDIAHSLKSILEGQSRIGALLKEKAEKLFSVKEEEEEEEEEEERVVNFRDIAFSGEEAMNKVKKQGKK